MGNDLGLNLNGDTTPNESEGGMDSFGPWALSWAFSLASIACMFLDITVDVVCTLAALSLIAHVVARRISEPPPSASAPVLWSRAVVEILGALIVGMLAAPILWGVFAVGTSSVHRMFNIGGLAPGLPWGVLPLWIAVAFAQAARADMSGQAGNAKAS